MVGCFEKVIERVKSNSGSLAVVVEKPFTTTSAEADALIATSKETGKLLTVFQNRRYDSDFLTLQRILSSSCLGPITEFQNHYDSDNPPWVRGWTSPEPVPGQGMLYGLGTHSLDQTLLLFGKPASVTAFTRALRSEGGKADDSFTVVLQYAGDLICTVKTTIVSVLPMERQVKFMARGREGTFLKVSVRDVALSQLHNTDSRVAERRRPSNRPALRRNRSLRSLLRRRTRQLPRRAFH
jgi:predicted dehydrogenase